MGWLETVDSQDFGQRRNDDTRRLDGKVVRQMPTPKLRFHILTLTLVPAGFASSRSVGTTSLAARLWSRASGTVSLGEHSLERYQKGRLQMQIATLNCVQMLSDGTQLHAFESRHAFNPTARVLNLNVYREGLLFDSAFCTENWTDLVSEMCWWVEHSERC